MGCTESCWMSDLSLIGIFIWGQPQICYKYRARHFYVFSVRKHILEICQESVEITWKYLFSVISSHPQGSTTKAYMALTSRTRTEQARFGISTAVCRCNKIEANQFATSYVRVGGFGGPGGAICAAILPQSEAVEREQLVSGSMQQSVVPSLKVSYAQCAFTTHGVAIPTNCDARKIYFINIGREMELRPNCRGSEKLLLSQLKIVRKAGARFQSLAAPVLFVLIPEQRGGITKHSRAQKRRKITCFAEGSGFLKFMCGSDVLWTRSCCSCATKRNAARLRFLIPNDR